MKARRRRSSVPRRNIPHSIEIKRKVTYQVAWVDAFPDPRIMGLCCPDSKTIFIKRGMSKKNTWLTFVHEVEHAKEFEYGYHLGERIVKLLEKSTLALWKLNGWI